MSTNQHTRISVAMLMDELRDRAAAVSRLSAEHQAAVDSRNELLFDLKALGVPERSLMKLTGLSRASVSSITQGARSSSAVRISDSLASTLRPTIPSAVSRA